MTTNYQNKPYTVICTTTDPQTFVRTTSNYRSAQIIARFLNLHPMIGGSFDVVERDPSTYSPASESLQKIASTPELASLVYEKLIEEILVNPMGLPKWTAFEYELPEGGPKEFTACREHDHLEIFFRLKDTTHRKRGIIYAETPTEDQILDDPTYDADRDKHKGDDRPDYEKKDDIECTLDEADTLALQAASNATNNPAYRVLASMTGPFLMRPERSIVTIPAALRFAVLAAPEPSVGQLMDVASQDRLLHAENNEVIAAHEKAVCFKRSLNHIFVTLSPNAD